jgi:hypothetical protein
VLPAEEDAVTLAIAPTALTVAHVETTAPILDIPGGAAPMITIVRAAETASVLSITFLEQSGFATAITQLVIMLTKEIFPVIALPVLNEAAVTSKLPCAKTLR